MLHTEKKNKKPTCSQPFSLKTTLLELAGFKHKIASSHFLTCQRESYIKGILQALRFIRVSGEFSVTYTAQNLAIVLAVESSNIFL